MRVWDYNGTSFCDTMIAHDAQTQKNSENGLGDKPTHELRPKLRSTMKRQLLIWLIRRQALLVFLLPYANAQKSFAVENEECSGRECWHCNANASGHGVRIKLNLKNLPAGSMRFIFTRWQTCEGQLSNPLVRHFNPADKKPRIEKPDGTSCRRYAIISGYVRTARR